MNIFQNIKHKNYLAMRPTYIDCTPHGFEIIKEHKLDHLIPGLLINVGDPKPDKLNALLKSSQAIINGRTILDAKILKKHAHIKTIVFLGTGPSTYIDMEAAKRLGIQVIPVIGYGDRTNAEHAIALMFAAARNIASMDRQIRDGVWQTQMGLELKQKQLGVIGAGRIGQEVIRIAAAIGMQVVCWNRSPIKQGLPCKQVSLDELLQGSDIISLHLALTEETRHLLAEKELSKLKPSCIVVNAARGELIDEEALINALTHHKIKHAALDVFDQEPLPKGHPFLALDNVTLTAHAAFSSQSSMLNLLKMGIENLAHSLK